MRLLSFSSATVVMLFVGAHGASAECSATLAKRYAEYSGGSEAVCKVQDNAPFEIKTTYLHKSYIGVSTKSRFVKGNKKAYRLAIADASGSPFPSAASAKKHVDILVRRAGACTLQDVALSTDALTIFSIVCDPQ